MILPTFNLDFTIATLFSSPIKCRLFFHVHSLAYPTTIK